MYVCDSVYQYLCVLLLPHTLKSKALHAMLIFQQFTRAMVVMTFLFLEPNDESGANVDASVSALHH